jgi:hypothetical protein
MVNQAGNSFTMTIETLLLSVDDCCSIPYFRTMVATEIKRMTELCDVWEQKLDKNREIISDGIEVKLEKMKLTYNLIICD